MRSMGRRWREYRERVARRAQEEGPPGGGNLFEAATAYVVACVEHDEEARDRASARVDPDALMFGVSELSRRALATLAADRGTSPEAVARALLGLPDGGAPAAPPG